MGTLKRLILPAALLLAAYWAVFGGEYSLPEVRAAHLARAEEEARLARVRSQIDSLLAWTDSLENDPGTLERLARERFGLIREGETLYRFAEPPDTASGPSSP